MSLWKSKVGRWPKEIADARAYWQKVSKAQDAVMQQSRYINKYINNAHLCVRLEPAIKKLCALVTKLEKLEGKKNA